MKKYIDVLVVVWLTLVVIFFGVFIAGLIVSLV